MPITHATTTAASDNPAYDVSANEWNADHVGTGITQAFVGYNTAGASWETFITRRHFCKQITLANDCLVTSIDCYVRGSTDNVMSIGVVLLTDVAGAPSVLMAAGGLADGQSQYLSNSASMPSAARWFATPLGMWVPAGTYWIGVAEFSARADLAYDGSGTDQYYTATLNVLTGAYPSVFAITTGSRKYSIRANTIR